MRTVVTDTSFLIDAMERRTSRSGLLLEELLEECAAGRVTLAAPAPVIAELFRGAASDDGLSDRLDRLLAAFFVVDTTEEAARLAAARAVAVDLRGLPARERPGIVDAIVAQAADDLGAELVATDPHFRHFTGLDATVVELADGPPPPPGRAPPPPKRRR